MSLESSPRPSYRIFFYNPETSDAFMRSNLLDEEVSLIESYWENRPPVTNFSALLYPVRTNNFKNFALDLFLPATMQAALRIENVVLKVFAILAGVALDVLTLPIRLITALPRAIYNHVQPDSPLTEMLKRFDAPREIISSGRVKIEIRMDTNIPDAAERYEEVIFTTSLIAYPWYKGCTGDRYRTYS